MASHLTVEPDDVGCGGPFAGREFAARPLVDAAPAGGDQTRLPSDRPGHPPACAGHVRGSRRTYVSAGAAVGLRRAPGDGGEEEMVRLEGTRC